MTYLPPRTSIYDSPAALPGVPLTKEQEEQALVAQVAKITLATAAAKEAIAATTTKHLMIYMRSLDLTSEAGLKAFKEAAKLLVGIATRKSQEVTWSAVAVRARLVGATMATNIPPREKLPAKVNASRGSSLGNAYARVVEEYRDNLKRTKDDNVISEIVSRIESQGATIIQRPETVTNDVIRNPDVKKEATSKDKGRVDSWAESSSTSRATLERAKEIAEALERQSYAGNSDAETSDITDAKDTSPKVEGYSITDEEIDIIIERYAEQKAEERLERMVSHDVQAASRNIHNVAINAIQGKKLAGFRRVIHPELNKTKKSCGLCIVASTMWYTKRDLLPIHNGCKCETVEIYDINGEIFDPGGAINEYDLEYFYKIAGDSTHGWNLKKAKYKVVDHPEYGPTLVPDLSEKKSRELGMKTSEGVRLVEQKYP